SPRRARLRRVRPIGARCTRPSVLVHPIPLAFLPRGPCPLQTHPPMRDGRIRLTSLLLAQFVAALQQQRRTLQWQAYSCGRTVFAPPYTTTIRSCSRGGKRERRLRRTYQFQSTSRGDLAAPQ